MSRDSFIFLSRYSKSFAKLNMEQRGILITAMMNYQIGEELPEMDALTDMAFSFIKDDMDFTNQRYEEKCEKNRENGKKGGRPKANGLSDIPEKANGFSENPEKANGYFGFSEKTLSESESESESESDYESESESEKEKDILSDQVNEIVGYLNEKLGTNYKASTKSTRQQIKGRLDEGHTVDDFKIVIDKKVRAWKDDPKMSQYLRPETLFRPGHFESYLNEIEVNRASPPAQKKSTEEIPRAVYEKIHNFHERTIDFAALEAEALGK